MNISFEFFPPKTELGFDKLLKVVESLQKFSPEFCSITYGAGGSTRDNTYESVKMLTENGFSVAPHVSCITEERDFILDLINKYKQADIKRIVALRGDLPSGSGIVDCELMFAADLVELIRLETGDYFQIYVAAYPEVHPQSKSYESEIKHFIEKVNKGANAAITQYFLNCDSYFYFVDELHKCGVDIPVIPGIMPFSDINKIVRFSQFSGIEIPRWLVCRMDSLSTIEEKRKFATEFIINMCEKLIAYGVPSLHVYTLNSLEPSASIIDALCNRYLEKSKK